MVGLVFLQEPQELRGRLVFCRQQTGGADDVLQEEGGEISQLGTFKVLALFLLLSWRASSNTESSPGCV